MRNGFDFKLTINKIDSVKPRQAGESEINGELVSWGWAVKFSTRNKILVEDKDFVHKEVETTLIIEVPCDSKVEAVNVNDFLLKLSHDPKPFNGDINLPSKGSNGYTTKTKLKGTDFIKLFDRK